MTLLSVGFGLWASLWPDAGSALQYDRPAISRGEIWRPLTAHFVHWSGRMAAADLGAVLILGAWLELRSRRLAIACLAGGAILIGVAIHFLLPGFGIYRGASGIASALFAAVALDLLGSPRSGGARWLAGIALALFSAKIAFEASTGRALAAGPLPAGVWVAPQVHLIGAAVGVLAWLLLRRMDASTTPAEFGS